jgi:hypothetical protein
MTLESRIESRAVLELAKIGAVAIKVGHSGWPDRCVVYAPGRCVWMEFKQPGGTVQKQQKIRRKELAKVGHEVHYPTSWREAVGIVAAARRRLEKK